MGSFCCPLPNRAHCTRLRFGSGAKAKLAICTIFLYVFLCILYIFSLVFFPVIRYHKDRIEEKEVLYSMSILNHVRALDVDDLIFGSEQKQTISDR